MKKTNKIHVAISADNAQRAAMIQKLIIGMGFASIPSDASKIIAPTPYDIDYANTYFVFADLYNFRDSNITTQKLYEMAARGFAVVIGVKKIPPEHEFLCTAYYPSDFTRL